MQCHNGGNDDVFAVTVPNNRGHGLQLGHCMGSIQMVCRAWGIEQLSCWAARRRGRRRYPRCGKELTLFLLSSELVESVFWHMVPEGNNGG